MCWGIWENKNMSDKKINIFGIVSTITPIIVLIIFALFRLEIFKLKGDDSWGYGIMFAIIMIVALIIGLGASLISLTNTEAKKNLAIVGLILNGAPLIYVASNLA